MKMVVTLLAEASNDTEIIQIIYNAIKQFKGVESVITVPQDGDYNLAVEDAKTQLKQQVMTSLDSASVKTV